MNANARADFTIVYRRAGQERSIPLGHQRRDYAERMLAVVQACDGNGELKIENGHQEADRANPYRP